MTPREPPRSRWRSGCACSPGSTSCSPAVGCRCARRTTRRRKSPTAPARSASSARTTGGHCSSARPPRSPPSAAAAPGGRHGGGSLRRHRRDRLLQPAQLVATVRRRGRRVHRRRLLLRLVDGPDRLHRPVPDLDRLRLRVLPRPIRPLKNSKHFISNGPWFHPVRSCFLGGSQAAEVLHRASSL